MPSRGALEIPNKRYQCDMGGCKAPPLRFPDPYSLYRHRKTVHRMTKDGEASPTWLYFCDEPGCKRGRGVQPLKGFNRRDNLRDHIKRKHPSKSPAAPAPSQKQDETTGALGPRRIDAEDTGDVYSSPELRPTKRRRENLSAEESDTTGGHQDLTLLRHELNLEKTRNAELTARLHESERKCEELQKKYYRAREQHQETLLGIIGQLARTQQGK